MVARVNFSLPVMHQVRSYAAPAVAALAFVVLGIVLMQVVRSLRGRVQQMPAQQLRAELLVNRAFAHIKKKQFNEAHADFLLALSYKPAPAVLTRIYLGKVDLYNSLKDYAQTLADLNAALALNLSDPHLRAQILSRRAQANINMDRLETVLQDVVDALAWSSDDSELCSYIYRVRGDYHARVGDHGVAIEDYRHALNDQPDARIFYKRGRSFSVLERWDDALRDFTNGLAVDFSDRPLRVDLLRERANVYFMQGEYQWSVDDLSMAIELSPPENHDQLSQMRDIAIKELNPSSPTEPPAENRPTVWSRATSVLRAWQKNKPAISL